MADTKKPKDRTPTLHPRRSAPAPSERWEKDTNLGSTVRMDSAPGASVRQQTTTEIPRPAPVPRAAGKSVELFVIDETQLPGAERKPWRAAEVWTKRRVYGLDSTFRCVEILDRETGRPEIGHDMLGARLGGGRLREKDTVRFSYPLPLPGMEAMFMKGKKHGYTSAVERMIVRIRVLHTSADEATPSWDEIALRWSEPPPR
ncbi:MAG TPA: hypothetical protein VM925_26645 [Labilithrix sp.]|jgi:hypothetical protein|nr:hypothetical protein [Labilithrix sp.]